MSASNPDPASPAPYAGFTPIEEIIRRMKRPPKTFEEWAASAPDNLFESDEEYDEFLTWLRAERQRGIG